MVYSAITLVAAYQLATPRFVIRYSLFAIA
jgi:hypothetical protein